MMLCFCFELLFNQKGTQIVTLFPQKSEKKDKKRQVAPLPEVGLKPYES